MNRIRFTNTGGSMWILVESRTQFLILKVIRLRNKRNIVPEQWRQFVRRYIQFTSRDYCNNTGNCFSPKPVISNVKLILVLGVEKHDCILLTFLYWILITNSLRKCCFAIYSGMKIPCNLFSDPPNVDKKIIYKNRSRRFGGVYILEKDK